MLCGIGGRDLLRRRHEWADGGALKPGVGGSGPLKPFDCILHHFLVTARGERKREEGEKEENFPRKERPYGSFLRSFTLPDSVDANCVRATYVNGVLYIEFAKCAEAKPKQTKGNFGQKAFGSGTRGLIRPLLLR